MAQDMKMVEKDPKTISSMALTTRVVAVMALTKQGGYPQATGSSC